MSRTIFVRPAPLELQITFATTSTTLVALVVSVNKTVTNDVMDKYYIDIKNNSHYFTDWSKKKFRLVNGKSFAAQRSNQLSYYVRCYYHYKHVEALGGFTLFYTLTYNNAALPHFHGVPCLDYNDLRWLFKSSGFDKMLQRKYGYKLQYFVTCELGDGKGSRGYGNNPHYHCLFFLTPIKKTDNRLTADVFDALIKSFWQGNAVSPRNYRYGICMPGDNYGIVTSGRAISYVAKYVLKDTVYYSLYNRIKKACCDDIYSAISVRPMFQRCYMNYVDRLKREYKTALPPASDPLVFACVERLFDRLYKKEVRNRYIPKVRISHGVGLACLDKVNPDGLTINIPLDNKIVSLNLPMYVYRKLYYDIVKDDADNNKYVLNESGIALRAANLSKMLLDSHGRIIDFVLNYQNIYGHSEIIDSYDVDVLYRYVVYDKIYRDRLLPFYDVPINPTDDYVAFQLSEYYQAPYASDVERVLFMSGKNTYRFHPYFAPYMKLFDYLDDIQNNYYLCQDEEKKRKYDEVRNTKRVHSIEKFNSYVRQLR